MFCTSLSTSGTSTASGRTGTVPERALDAQDPPAQVARIVVLVAATRLVRGRRVRRPLYRVLRNAVIAGAILSS